MKIELLAPVMMAALVAACSSDATNALGPNDDAGGSGDGRAPAGEFAALTYNVAGLPEGLSGSHPAMNTQYISPLLDDYDLVLVQEDWLTPDPNPTGMRLFHDVLAASAHHPFQSIPAPCPGGANPARPSALVSDGLNEFSRFEFRDLTRTAWQGCFGALGASDGGASDCGAMKGFSVAVHVLSAGVEVDVYDLHGEAGSTATDQQLQEAGYGQLAAFINDFSRGHAVILGGDTNLHTESTNPDAAIWQTLLADTGLSDVCQTVECGADRTIIDKFAFRSNDAIIITPLTHRFERDKFVRPDGMPLSDHNALTVRFRWTKVP
ncbi:MAG TPA: hypothetical protein VK540_27795 [Polyangiaceae bacterium]|nr:hypothetical protein [Polyangiaceae bacterium]